MTEVQSDQFRPLFCFTADTHLDICRSVRHPAMRGDSRFAFSQIVTYCVEHSLPLLLGGDIFDKPRPDPGTVRFALDELRRMQTAGLPVYFVQGDHDIDPVQPWPALSDASTHLHQRVVNFPGGIVVWGQDFVPRAHAAEAFGMVPETANVLLTHISWSDLRRIGATHADLTMVPHVHHVLTGDYHVACDVTATGASGQTIIAISPGSTNSRALNEPTEKSFVVVGLDGSTRMTWRRVPLRSRRQLDVVINTADDLEQVIRQAGTWLAAAYAADLPEELRKPVVWAKFRDDIPDAYVRLAAAFGTDAFLFVDPQHVETVIQVDASSVVSESLTGLREAIGILRPERDRVYADACRLLDAVAIGRLRETVETL